MAPADWTGTPPNRFDIATGFYPEDSPKMGFQSHPCLILKTQRGRTTGRLRCLVIYGSSNLRPGRHAEGNDLIISDPRAVRDVGLFKPTRFYFSDLREVYLPWDESGFECWDGFRTPVIGRLTEPMIREAEHCLMHRARQIGS